MIGCSADYVFLVGKELKRTGCPARDRLGCKGSGEVTRASAAQTEPAFCRPTALVMHCRNGFESNRYLPFTNEQWVEAVFHVPESFTQVSLQMTVRARCVPLSSAS
jgi:hypothetical protein